MNVEDIPQELIDILNARAGKTHKPTSNAVQTLAEILTRYDEILADRQKPPKSSVVNITTPRINYYVENQHYPHNPNQIF